MKAGIFRFKSWRETNLVTILDTLALLVHLRVDEGEVEKTSEKESIALLRRDYIRLDRTFPRVKSFSFRLETVLERNHWEKC